MRFLSCFFAAFAISPAPDVPQITSQPTKTASLPSFIPKSSLSSSSTSLLSDGVSNWIAATASVSAIGSAQAPPSQADVQLLRKAFAEFYGVERDLDASLVLLTQVVERWQGQPPDELAGLYRVRGDCYTLLADSKAAVSDYTKAIELLQGPGGDQADPIELPSALLGRARALKSQGTALTKAQTKQAAGDYELSLKLTSREDWDTDAELLEDGATRNPYAAWEWGTVLRQANDWKQAAYAHSLAGTAFDEIGDKPRGVMAVIDAGIDLAGGSGQTSEAKSILQKAIAKTKGIEARDVGLLQRLIAKEGEGRMALAALLWDEGSVADAEATLGRACERLEQLQVDASQRNAKKDGVPLDEPKRLKFSIDDTNPAVSMSCSRFKNSAFLDEQLGWSESLQKK